MSLHLPVVEMKGVILTDLDRHVWDGYLAGEIRYQYFPASDGAQFPPLPRLRGSGDDSFEWRVSGGSGVVVSWTIVSRPANPDSPAPYAPAIVELDEGVQLLACIAGCEPGDVQIGMRVAARFSDVGEGFRVPYFVPDGGFDE